MPFQQRSGFPKSCTTCHEENLSHDHNKILTFLDASCHFGGGRKSKEGTNNTKSVLDDNFETTLIGGRSTGTSSQQQQQKQQRILDNGCPAYIIHSNLVMPL